jgi:hypothetical protein
MQDGVAEDEVEALVLEGQLLGLGHHGLRFEPQPLRRLGKSSQHSG